MTEYNQLLHDAQICIQNPDNTNSRTITERLINLLNRASETYYNSDTEIMTNLDYDKLYDTLIALEHATGIILENSPTQNAGYAIQSNLPKIEHEYPALSLDKTKDIELFEKVFDLRDKMAVIMWKEDGSTVVATYDDGTLTTLATRGNGKIGQDITHNAHLIHGLPMTIPFSGHAVVRGEAVMSYTEFERINASLPEGKKPYDNPRNLVNATIQLTAERKMDNRIVNFHAFKLVHMDREFRCRTFERDMYTLSAMRMDTTQFNLVPVENLTDALKEFSKSAKDYGFPVDGLVVAANDVRYAEKQPGTGKHPNRLVGFALKWQDDTVNTTLRKIEWSPSRTGLINPVAVFDPIRLEGTTVERASIHNVSILKQLRLRIGDEISVFKANKIIPQIAENLSFDEPLSDSEASPETCPCCKQPVTIVKTENNKQTVEIALCKNPDCAAKHIGKFTHFCERDCMNILGMSEATLTKFIERNWIHEFADIYHLNKFKDEITAMEGFGEKSYRKITEAVEASRKTSFIPFIHALGIPNIGEGQAKIFAKAYDHDIMTFLQTAADPQSDFTNLDGIGPILNDSLKAWSSIYLRYLHDPSDDCNTEIKDLLKELTFQKPKQQEHSEPTLAGLTFVITGDLKQYKNRKALQTVIEENGGKVSGSVSSKTNYLINNDVSSTSGKNKKAKELNIPIISENEFIAMFPVKIS